jgi:hypothetical protein
MSADVKKDKEHILLEPDEWEDRPGRKVISEFRKGSAPSDDSNVQKNQTSKDKGTTKSTKLLDLSTVEMMSYAFARTVFPKGVRVPLKLENVVDMDVAIKDTDIILNTNNVSFELPPLHIWHVVFSFKGKPIFEFGRGVHKNLKIHYGRAIPFLISMWFGRRKRHKARKKATENACKDLSNSANKESCDNARSGGQ